MNPNTIPWEHYQDLQVNDLRLKDQFDAYISSGNYVEALSLLRTNEQKLIGKAYVSKTINTILNGVLELESYFNNGVNIFLSDLAISYINLIENFKNMGAWNDSIDYTPYNFVIYNNEIYMNIKDAEEGILPTDSTYWLKLGLRGIDGAYSVDLNMKYQWSDSRQYDKNDIVVYQGSLYVALRQNKNKNPESATLDWLLFISVEKGGIIVSVTEPNYDKVSQNSIWFKPDKEAISTIVTTSGTFYRFTGREWEIMYPATLFNWVNNIEKYAPLAKTKTLNIESSDWGFLNGVYYYVYNDNDIKQNSHITITPHFNSADYKRLYNILEAEYDTGAIRFSIKKKPIYDLTLDIKIQ